MHPWTTCLALVCAAVMALAATAVAGDARTPVVCGSNGCTPLPTATLQGLLTLPGALGPAEAPAAELYFVFRVEDTDGAVHRVVYVARDGGALLGFEGEARWRRVPVDDAQLLADAARSRTPYAAPAADAPLGALLAAAHDQRGGTSAAWLALGTVLLVGAAVAVLIGALSHPRWSDSR